MTTDELHNILGKYFSGQASPEEEQLIRQWVEESDENRADFRLLEKLWNKSGEHEELTFDTEKAWQQVDARIRPAKPQAPVRRINVRLRAAIAVAALLIVALGAWWITGGITGNKTVVADIAMKEVLLEDGSRVYLRKGSTLHFPKHFAADSRKVKLEGEAFFEVTPNTAKPFTVRAAAATVQVVGTSFNVNTANNKVDLVVKTGRVKFGSSADASGQVLVTAGERATLQGNSVQKQVNTDENFNAWQTGQLVFSNTPLSEVVATLNNYFNVSIAFSRQDATQLSTTGLTARFSNQELDAVLNEISLITSYRIRKTGDNQYEISLK